ncbi:MAG: hypothetical protein WBN70_13255 [Polyangiales bacterium]
MSFSAVDPTLKDWALRSRMRLSTQYQDAEVRSFELVGPNGRAQIWVEVSAGITVHVWDYQQRSQVFAVDNSALADGLDDALRAAKAWCGTP